MIEVGILEWSNLWRLNFLSIFGRHDPFPQDFGLVLRRIMPYLIEKTEVFEINYKKVISSCLPNCIFPLRSLSAEKSAPLRKVIIFNCFWQFWSLSPRFWAGQSLIFTKYARNSRSCVSESVRSYFFTFIIRWDSKQ